MRVAMHRQASGRAAAMEAELEQLRARRDAMKAEASAMRARHSDKRLSS